MLKRGIFLLLIFLLLTINANSQESELTVRFHSTANMSTINLTKYMGDAEEYFSSESENVGIVINQELGIAVLRAKPDWVGVETIIFSVNKTIIDNETGIFVLKGKRISDEELERLFEGSLGENFEVLTSTAEREDLKKVLAKLEENKLKINLNDELEIDVGRKENKPEFEINFLLPKGSPATISFAGFETYIGYVLLTIFAILAIFLIFTYFRDYIEYYKSKIDYKEIINTTLIRLGRLKKNLNEESDKEFLEIMEYFFAGFLNIKKFDYYRIIIALRRSNLNVGAKIQLRRFLDDYSQVMHNNLSKKDLKILIDRFISIIKRCR